MYMPDLSGMIEGDLVELKPDESRHLRALRLRAGDVVSITDGKGALWQGKLEDRGRGMGIQLGTRATAPGALPVELWAPVGNKQAMLWLVEKATELGVSRIQPVEFEYVKLHGFRRRCRTIASILGKSPQEGRLGAEAERRRVASRVDAASLVSGPAGPPGIGWRKESRSGSRGRSAEPADCRSGCLPSDSVGRT